MPINKHVHKRDGFKKVLKPFVEDSNVVPSQLVKKVKYDLYGYTKITLNQISKSISKYKTVYPLSYPIQIKSILDNGNKNYFLTKKEARLLLKLFDDFVGGFEEVYPNGNFPNFNIVFSKLLLVINRDDLSKLVYRYISYKSVMEFEEQFNHIYQLIAHNWEQHIKSELISTTYDYPDSGYSSSEEFVIMI